LIAITGGEPLMHPDFEEIIKSIFKRGFRWTLATNATLLDPKICTFLINHKLGAITISLDGDSKCHDSIRGQIGSFEKTMQGIENIYSFHNIIRTIMFTTVVHNSNIEKLEQIEEIVAKFPKTVWRLNPILYDPKHTKSNLYINKEIFSKLIAFVRKFKKKNYENKIMIGEYNQLTEKYNSFFTQEFNFCTAGVTTCGVLANGDIVGCMVNRDNVLGNINKDDTISKIWKLNKRNKNNAHKLCKYHAPCLD
jgi:sulfatase maturation enzyme AslB (radical SAM superfamily)